MQSNDLRDLLTYFARPDNQSFCLVTSRAPLLDLMEYTTYTHRDVERLDENDGRDLLRKLGVKGSDDALNKVVRDWDGHALTLSLLAAILSERYAGDVAHIADLPAPTANEPRYERVHRVLRRYDEHLTDAEREFLKLFSAFRTPVKEDAFEKVFVPLMSKSQKPKSKLLGFVKLEFGISDLKALVDRLVTYRILHFDAHDRTYTTHPLIRNHYLALLTKGDKTQEKNAHEHIKDYYLSIAGDTPEYPTLEDLKPLIEVVHHACEAEAYDEAWKIYWERIDRSGKGGLTWILGAYDTELTLCSEFFPSGDLSRDSLMSVPGNNRYMLNNIGWCLMSLGCLHEAVPLFERVIPADLADERWQHASAAFRNLAELYLQIAELKSSADVANQAFDLARRAEDKFGESQSLSYQARATSLFGKLQVAEDIFSQAEKVEVERHNRDCNYLYSNRGIFHADHLRRRGNLLDFGNNLNRIVT